MEKDYDAVIKEIRIFQQYNNFKEAFECFPKAETIKKHLSKLIIKEKEIIYESEHLCPQNDIKTGFELIFEDFEYYHKIWKFISDWRFVSFRFFYLLSY
jgi:hypothetical protein